MVSGFLTSPCDHSRIFSGDASEMRIALKESGSLGFSKKLKMSRIGCVSFVVAAGGWESLGGHRSLTVAALNGGGAAIGAPGGAGGVTLLRRARRGRRAPRARR